MPVEGQSVHFESVNSGEGDKRIKVSLAMHNAEVISTWRLKRVIVSNGERRNHCCLHSSGLTLLVPPPRPLGGARLREGSSASSDSESYGELKQVFQ
jgi:hypothetical protein